MPKPLIFIARQIPDIGLQLLGEQAEVRIHSGELPPTRSELLEGVRGCDGILSLLSDRIDSEVFDAAGGQLKVVSNFAVGYNNISVVKAHGEVSQLAIRQTCLPKRQPISPLLYCCLLRDACRKPRATSGGGWKTWEPRGWIGLDLVRKTVGIVGLGRIGEAVARRLHGGSQFCTPRDSLDRVGSSTRSPPCGARNY